MKRWMIVVLSLVAAMAIGLFVVSYFVRSTSRWAQSLHWPDPDVAALADGEYEGTATLKLPPGTAAAGASATVRLRVHNGRYEAIEVVAPDTIKGPMTAFAQVVIERQSLRPDAISGGTVTKAAVLAAAANAVSSGPVR